MNSSILPLLLNDGLWLLIIVGWFVLIMSGLETDKPLSGGIPGHLDSFEKVEVHEGFWGRLGEIGAWVVLVSISLSLPVVLWWIFVVHR